MFAKNRSRRRSLWSPLAAIALLTLGLLAPIASAHADITTPPPPPPPTGKG